MSVKVSYLSAKFPVVSLPRPSGPTTRDLVDRDRTSRENRTRLHEVVVVRSRRRSRLRLGVPRFSRVKKQERRNLQKGVRRRTRDRTQSVGPTDGAVLRFIVTASVPL